MPPLGQGSFVRSITGSIDDRAHVVFYKEAIQNQGASMEHGRPIYQEKELVSISFPGNQLFEWVGEATDEHRQKYPRQYEAFLRGEEVAHEGTPIEQMTVLNKAQVKELKYFNIYTIEDAASMTEQACQQFMGGSKLREMAKKYLEQANGFAPIAALVSKNENLESQLAAMKLQMDELNRLFAGQQEQLQRYAQAPLPPQLQAPVQQPIQAIPQPTGTSSLDSLGAEPAPKRRGRPPKVQEAA